MIEVAVQLNGNMIKFGVAVRSIGERASILPGIDGNTSCRRYAGITEPVAGSAYTGTDRLQYKGNTVCTIIIGAAEKNVKTKLEGLIEADLVIVPY